MEHPQTPTTVATENSASNITVNGTAKQKNPDQQILDFIGCAIESEKTTSTYYRRRGRKIFLTNFQKSHPIWHHKTMQTKKL